MNSKKETERGSAIMKIIQAEPANIEELKTKATTKDDWELRLSAVNELAKYDCQKSRYILTKLASSDRVFAVKEAAFNAAEAMGITKKGLPLVLKRRDIGYSSKDFAKIFGRVKRDLQTEEFDLAAFKKQFQAVSPEMYDVMQYEEQENFDLWITALYENLR
ncbi:MAG: HEAT repeat domain-containing protein [Carnobacterium sp.]